MLAKWLLTIVSLILIHKNPFLTKNTFIKIETLFLFHQETQEFNKILLNLQDPKRQMT